MTDRKPTICCDMDDTIEYLCEAWCAWLNNKYNVNINWKDIDQWDMTKVYPMLTKKEIYQALEEPDMWKTVKPIEGAYFYIKKLIDEGYPFYIVTTSHHKVFDVKLCNCLFRLFPFIDRHNIILTCNKQMIRCDVLIDDGPHNIVGEYLGLLMNAPHNRYFDENNYSSVKRVYTWEEIYNICTNLKN